MTNKPERKIGAHVSAAGGVDRAIERASAIGCNCVQLFSGSPRVWAKPELSKVDVEKLSSECAKKHVSPIFTHALYLVNLASDKPALVEKSVASLTYELQFDALVGGAGVVVHLGSHQGRGFDAVKEQLVDQLDALLRATPENSRLLIENAASRNGKIGGDLAEISYLLIHLEKKGGWVTNGRLGWCFDTCHGFAAGYYLGDSSSLANKPAVGKQPELILQQRTSAEVGVQSHAQTPLSAFQVMTVLDLLDSLVCLHINDSKDPLASNRDRHENLGEGTINQQDLKWFLARPEFATKPLIMEAPGFDGKGPDKENIDRLKALVV